MLEKILLSILITLSLYLSFGSEGFKKNLVISSTRLSNTPEQIVNPWE
jgi:hypothetical protein